MGLIMYLNGITFVSGTVSGHPEKRPKLDGFEIEEYLLSIAYWEKNAPLHKYIVNSFNGSVDDCQPIDLSHENLTQIIRDLSSARSFELALSDIGVHDFRGHFFGSKEQHDQFLTEDGIKKTREVFENALDYMIGKKANPPNEGDPFYRRSVIYSASW